MASSSSYQQIVFRDDGSFAEKPKRRRNKRTLNCGECVERKTKCDKARPECSACARRRTTCHYLSAADAVTGNGHRRASTNTVWTPFESVKRESSAETSSGDFRSASADGHSFNSNLRSPIDNTKDKDIDVAEEGFPGFATFASPQQYLASKDEPGLFNIFDSGSRHVFHNYWTSTGGLPEVISVLPCKNQADLLVEKYFEAIDPLYPIIWYPDFHLEYENFWALPLEEKHKYDAGQLSLHFVIYAIGTQLMEVLAPDEREHTAGFYLSASHQSLCIFSYLNCFSLSSIQTMVLICNLLVSKNHVSDAWTFSGITHRQAYGLELNRNPDMMRPELSCQEKQQRAKLWQAIMFQDTSLSLYLGFPPSTLHYDVPLTYLEGIERAQHTGFGDSRAISNSPSNTNQSSLQDSACLQAMWEYAAFVQTHICVPKSLGRPISTSPTHKAELVSQFRKTYSSWRPPFNSTDPGRFNIPDERLVRQLIAISSNYFYVLTVLYMDKNQGAGVVCDVFGALDAAHEALSAFFAHARLYPGQVDLWGTYHTRAFAQAMMIGTMLSAQEKQSDLAARDARIMLAKSDFDRYLDILMRAHGTFDYENIQRNRMAELQRLRNKIMVV